MIISQPNDGKGILYHVVNLYGNTVHAYRDADTAKRSVEGDQRIFRKHERTGHWLDGVPGVHPDILAQNPPPAPSQNPRDYKHIAAWGRMMGSFIYYIVAQQEKAVRTGAPLDAVYCRNDFPNAKPEDWVRIIECAPPTQERIATELTFIK